jgi:putative integral membrane protein (TIGR02587 family)
MSMDSIFHKELGRAFAGALIFAIPLLMTMEMWWMGGYLAPWRVALFVLLALPVLYGLSRFAGFRTTHDWFEDVVDALVAYAIGFVCAAFFLAVFAILEPGRALQDIFGKTALLSVPAGIGAVVAQKQLGNDPGRSQKRQASYGGEVFLMTAGALFFAFNVAPTEEMVLIGYKMTPWHALLLFAVSLLIMHTIVYTVGFKGQESGAEGFWPLFFRFSVVGYAVALAVSLGVLWIFGRLDGLGLEALVMTVIVLGFPAALGAALSRLIL